jgi:hypothetical protein
LKSIPPWSRVWAAAVLAAVGAAGAYGGSYVWWRGGEPTDSRGAYRTTQPLDEELLVPVSIWGEVRDPGYYDVPDGVNVTGLISYAGGPTEYANLARVKVTCPGSGAPTHVNVQRYLETGDEALVPVLRPGDTVYVPRNTKYAWREFIEVVSELAVIAGTALLYVEVAGRDR